MQCAAFLRKAPAADPRNASHKHLLLLPAPGETAPRLIPGTVIGGVRLQPAPGSRGSGVAPSPEALGQRDGRRGPVGLGRRRRVPPRWMLMLVLGARSTSCESKMLPRRSATGGCGAGAWWLWKSK